MKRIVKKINKLISIFGTDKVMHFLVGALITTFTFLSFFVFCGVNYISFLYAFAISTTSTFAISVTKEVVDEKADINDIKAGMYGCGVSVLPILLVFIIYLIVQ